MNDSLGAREQRVSSIHFASAVCSGIQLTVRATKDGFNGRGVTGVFMRTEDLLASTAPNHIEVFFLPLG